MANQNDILLQLLESSRANQQRASEASNFAQRLRDERMSALGEINRAAAPVFTGETAVPTNPIDRFDRSQAFLKAGEGIMAPVGLAQERADRLGEQEQNLLLQLLKQTTKDGVGVQPTIDPITGEEDFSSFTGKDALSIVNKTGRRLLSGGLNEKTSQAEAILSYGSVGNYLQQAPLSDIYSLKAFENEKKADEAGFELLRKVGAAQTFFSPDTKNDFGFKGNLTGPIASIKGFLRTKGQKEAQAIIGELSAEKVKELSGAAVSDAEFARLKKFLPQANMQEGEIATLLDNLDRGIRMNLKAREDAVRSGQSVAQYWNQNKNKYLSEFGFEGEQPSQKQRSGEFLIEEVK